MCIFGGRAKPTVNANKTMNAVTGSQAAYSPVRRPGGPVAQMYAKRTREATGTMGNIFTSPLGTSTEPATLATKLGGTSMPSWPTLPSLPSLFGFGEKEVNP